jgi:hypothetical protein
MQHRALRMVPDNRQVKFASTTQTAAQTKSRSVTSKTVENFFILTANAIGLSALTALTIWLAQGGAVDLVRTWQALFSNSPL